MAREHEVFQYLVGATDDGSAINMRYDSNDFPLKTDFDRIIYPVELLVEIQQGHDVQLMVSYDGKPFIPVGYANKGLTRIALDIDKEDGNFPRCRTIAISYREFSSSKIIFSRLALLYYETEEIEDREE